VDALILGKCRTPVPFASIYDFRLPQDQPVRAEGLVSSFNNLNFFGFLFSLANRPIGTAFALEGVRKKLGLSGKPSLGVNHKPIKGKVIL